MSNAARVIEVLTEEHHAIDHDIEAFIESADSSPDPAALHRAMDLLRRHIYVEEDLLFPPIQAAGLFMPIQVMLHEHGEMWRLLDAVDAELGGPADPERLRGSARAMLQMLDSHNQKEEPIVYPQTESDLTDDACARIVDFLASGSMPDGWQCQKAVV